MANPAPNPLIPMPTNAQELTAKPLNPKQRPHHSTAVQDAKRIQRLMMADMENPKTGPAVRASLARSWVLVQSLIQELRGIPKPGQLRPDLDPVQLSRALKRMRSRKPLLEISGSFMEAPTETLTETREEAHQGGEPKESLSTPGTVTAEGGGGED